MIALKRKVPVIVSPRGTLSTYSFHNKNIGAKGLMHQFLGKRLLSKCHIHVTSETEKEAVAKLIQPKSINALPNFVKLPVRKIYTGYTVSEPFKLLFFSRIEEKKGLDILIEALPGITVPFTLTVAGDGNADYIDTLKTLAKKNNVADKITWVGFKGEDKFELLQNHDLFVLPSHDENFGNVVIESLSAGTPVLISEHVGLAGYVQQNDFGWICKTDAGSVSSSVNEIANNQKDKLKSIREAAPGIIYGDFNEDKLVTRYINLYHKLATT